MPLKRQDSILGFFFLLHLGKEIGATPPKHILQISFSSLFSIPSGLRGGIVWAKFNTVVARKSNDDNLEGGGLLVWERTKPNRIGPVSKGTTLVPWCKFPAKILLSGEKLKCHH